MNKCIYCNKVININFLNFFIKNNHCLYCFSKFILSNKKIEKNFIINNENIKITYYLLFEYNEYAKDYMHFYKRKNDISLCLLFNDFLLNFFKTTFSLNLCTLTYIPSSEATFKLRKFCPNFELLNSTQCLITHSGPKRLDNIKQGKLSFNKRKKVKHTYKSAQLNINKNLIIFDDVISTGTSINNFLENIENLKEFENIYIVALFHSKNYK